MLFLNTLIPLSSHTAQPDIDNNWLQNENDGVYKTIANDEIIASCSVTENEDSDNVDEPAVIMRPTQK